MDELLQITAEVMKNYRIKNKKKNLPSQVKEIANLLGISPECFSHYEKGDRKIQFDLWFRWCNALQIGHRAVVEKINYELRKKHAKDKTE